MRFDILETRDGVQTATMVLEAGEASGPKCNEHPRSAQILYLASGELQAEIGERTFRIRAGESAIVPREAPHRFTNRASEPALTFNVYVPPAY